MGTAISITDKIDPKADISITREDELISKEAVMVGGNSIRIHAKKDKGTWLLEHDGKAVKSVEYRERGTTYSRNVLFCGTEKEVAEEIARLKLINLTEEEADGIDIRTS